MKHHRAAAIVAVALAAVCALGSGCRPQAKPVVTSTWPVATAEAKVPKPPEAPRWPLTGQAAPDDSAVLRRPLSIKIENSPEARPQTGLNSADVVYETVTEGGITRFNCIFQSEVPRVVGPVRSARLSDLWIVPQYQGLFFFSGASTSVTGALRKSRLPNLSQDAGIAAPYSRSSSRRAPHNLYLDTKKAYAEAVKRKMPTTVTQPSALKFGRSAADTTPTITSVRIPFSDANVATWKYDERSNLYLRETNGVLHADAATGKQVAARNVVVVWARYDPVSHDKVGSTTYDVALGGSGRVSVFRDGQRFDGTWEATRDTPPRFKRSDGTPIKLAAGNTWFQVVSLKTSIAMK